MVITFTLHKHTNGATPLNSTKYRMSNKIIKSLNHP